MGVYLLLFYCTTVSAVSRIYDPDLVAINFAQAIQGKKLNGSVFQEISVDSEISCQTACVKHISCLSYNFGLAKEDGKFFCQLSDSDRFASHENFTEDVGVAYRGIQSNCESDSSPCGDKGICIPDYQADNFKCKCDTGYSGIPCEPMKSCFHLLQDGITSTGEYTINPDGGKPIQVLCDMTTDGGGWTVFQRRLNGSVDFYLGWAAYKNGFGNLDGEFWLGNDNLHRLTAADDVKLRVDLEDFDSNITYAEYTTFKVADERDKYRLMIGGFNGTAGDSMTPAGDHGFTNGMQFSTKDQDNDLSAGHCAVSYKGGWWYNSCHRANLNGRYHGGPHDSSADGINWYTFRGYHYSLKRAEMKIRAKM